MARRSKRKRSDDPSRPAETAAPARAAVLPPTNIVVTLIKAAILIALGIYIYYPSLNGLYLWDDDFLIQNNPVVHDPRGIWYIWSDPEHALIDFFPLTVSVEWLIWQTFYDPIGMANDPQFWQMTFYFHITSLILHLIDGMMIWYLFRKMGIRLAWLGALIFVTHPVLVESVSWMAELKNTIAMPTFIIAVLAWLNFERTRRLRYYVLAFVFYLISMLTKTSGVMFPVIIILYDWWKNPETNFVELFFAELKIGFRAALALFNFGPGYFRRFRNESSQLRWTFVPTIPFFIVAVADAYFLIIYLRHGVGEQFIPGLLGGPIGRTACAGMSLLFYFSKCVLPVDLLPIYPQWPVVPPTDSNPIAWQNYIFYQGMAYAFCWPVIAFGFWWLWRRREQPWARAAFFGFGFFFLNVLPFVGWRAISFMRFGWVMDHFLYVPILGLIGLGAAAASDLYDRIPRAAASLRITAISAAVALVAIFTLGSHLYAGEFVDRLTYWTYECEHNWVAWPAHNNRGNQLLDNAGVAERKGFHAEANTLFAESKKEFQIALMLNPVYTEAHNNLGYILSREGDLKDAEAEFRTALYYTPDFESAQLNLKNVLQIETLQSYNQHGVDLMQQGQYKDAEAMFRQVLQYQPDNPIAQQNLSHVLELEATPPPAPAPEPKPTTHKSR